MIVRAKKVLEATTLTVLTAVLLLGCETTKQQKSQQVSSDQPVITEKMAVKPAEKSGVIEIAAEDPKAIEVIHEECNGAYEIFDDDEPQRQFEIGVTKTIGSKKPGVKAFIRYRCRE